MSRGKALAVLCAFEDRAVEDVVLPLVERVATREGRLVEPVSVLTHGCRFERLEEILRDHGDFGFYIVGADAGAAGSHVRKEKAMRKRLGIVIEGRRVVFAIPEPSAEGWIQADLRALRRGLREALDCEVKLSGDAGAYPSDEREAKRRLREIVIEATGAVPLRDGVEYGPTVMRHVALDAHASLEAFARDLAAVLGNR